MLNDALKQIKIAFLLVVFFTILTGLIYPFILTGLAQLLWPWKANGSLIEQNGKKIGSFLIGQAITNPKYFWGRPSATTPFPYNAANSSGSNLGPSNPALLSIIKERLYYLKQANPENTSLIPIELVTASGSGLDPEISPLAAYYQANRIAKARGVPPESIYKLIQNSIIDRSLMILGEPRLNVLLLNLELDKLQ